MSTVISSPSEGEESSGRSDSHLRSEQVYQCGICETMTNLWEVLPGGRQRIVCEGAQYYEHGDLESALDHFRKWENQVLDYERLRKQGVEVRHLARAFAINGMRIAKEKIDLLKAKIRSVVRDNIQNASSDGEPLALDTNLAIYNGNKSLPKVRQPVRRRCVRGSSGKCES